MGSAEKRIAVRTPQGAPYEIEIAPGSFDRVGQICAEHAPAHRYAIVSDGKVAQEYGQRALESFEGAGQADLFTFPAGEWNKTRSSWARLCDDMLAEGVGRDAVVVAVGGGVTGDLAGFVAATYMRGIPVVQVPTSLLAMLDSSVGGKTGVDTAGAKNCVGAFHHPAHVLIDPALLATLPRHQRLAGLAEGVKAGAVADADLFDWMERNGSSLKAGDTTALTELIVRAVSIKAEIVAEDPFEEGRRAILNFGHTVGHALEAASGYGLLHGEAVAIGMVIEAVIGKSLGITDQSTAPRLAELLAALDLPVEAEADTSADALLELTAGDKKARRGEARWVFLRRIGEVALENSGAFTHGLRGELAARELAAALRNANQRADSSA